MNFGMLKNMVENIVSSYKCPFCNSTEISEKHIDIVWAAGNTVNIDMECPSCKKHFMAKTEVMHMEVGNMNADKIAKLQQSLLVLKWKLWDNIDITSDIENTHHDHKNTIKDEDIVQLNSEMKKDNISAEDLFKE